MSKMMTVKNKLANGKAFGGGHFKNFSALFFIFQAAEMLNQEMP